MEEVERDSDSLIQKFNKVKLARREFYKMNRSCLLFHTIKMIPDHILQHIAVMVNQTVLYPKNSWKEYAHFMGIDDTMVIADIEGAAFAERIMPLYLCMQKNLANGSYVQIIDALLHLKRDDILEFLEDYTRKLLKSNIQRDIKSIEPTEEHSRTKTKLTFPSLSKTLTNTQGFPLPSINFEHCTIKESFVPFTKGKEHEFDAFQQHSINRTPASALQINIAPESIELPAEEIIVPSAPVQEMLYILIQHTEFESDIAEQLSIKLREEGMIVTTFSDMCNLTPYDATNALNTMFQEVDFIVPIISCRLIEEIYPRSYDLYLESSYSQNNRLLYQLIMNEYRNNRCVNFRVRPVIVPEMSKRLLIKDVILSFSFRLWHEVPKLIKILKENKKLMAQKLIH